MGLFFLTLVLCSARWYLEKRTPIGQMDSSKKKSLEDKRKDRIPFVLTDLPFNKEYTEGSFGTVEFEKNPWVAALNAPYEWVFVHAKGVEFDTGQLYELKPQDGVSVWPKPGEWMDFELFPEVYGAERFLTAFMLFHRPTCKVLLEYLASDDTLSLEEAVLLSKTPFTLRGDDQSVLGVQQGDGIFVGRYVCYDHEAIRLAVSPGRQDDKLVRLSGGKIEPMNLYAMHGPNVRQESVTHPSSSSRKSE